MPSAEHPSPRPAEGRPDTLLTFSGAARRLVDDGLVRSMTAEGLRKLARTHPEWPLGDSDYHLVAGVRLVPYERIADFVRTRSTRSGRGPDSRPRKPRRDRAEQ